MKKLKRCVAWLRIFENTARIEARTIIAKAHLDAEHEMALVKDKIKAQLVGLTMAATRAVLKEKLNGNERKQLITDSIEEIKIQ